MWRSTSLSHGFVGRRSAGPTRRPARSATHFPDRVAPGCSRGNTAAWLRVAAVLQGDTCPFRPRRRPIRARHVGVGLLRRPSAARGGRPLPHAPAVQQLPASDRRSRPVPAGVSVGVSSRSGFIRVPGTCAAAFCTPIDHQGRLTTKRWSLVVIGGLRLGQCRLGGCVAPRDRAHSGQPQGRTSRPTPVNYVKIKTCYVIRQNVTGA